LQLYDENLRFVTSPYYLTDSASIKIYAGSLRLTSSSTLEALGAGESVVYAELFGGVSSLGNGSDHVQAFRA